ncbi:MAG: hypothetical protein ACR65O_01775 [Methylomicrobium sp.]
MYQNLHFYVNIDLDEAIENRRLYFDKLISLINIIYQHNSKVFYNPHQIQEIKQYIDIDEDFTQSYGNTFGVIFKNAIDKTDEGYFFEVCYASQSTSLNYINNSAISIITPHNTNAVISTSSIDTTTLLFVKSSSCFELINFPVLSDVTNLLNWINSNSPTRRFNLSPKHGENGHGNWPNESVLLCSRLQAQELLNTAIPDFNYKNNRLFNFDVSHDTFIEFFYEGHNPQMQWHGFHVETDKWAQRIPDSILNYFDK